jgi:hypothetical protein
MAKRRRGGGLRGRLDRLEGNAHQTMNTAQNSVVLVREAALGFLEELQDGIRLELVKDPGTNLMDFFTGKVDKLPFSVRIVIDEDEE